MDIMVNGKRATSRGLCYSPEKAKAYLVKVRKVEPANIEVFRHPVDPKLYVVAWTGGTK